MSKVKKKTLVFLYHEWRSIFIYFMHNNLSSIDLTPFIIISLSVWFCVCVCMRERACICMTYILYCIHSNIRESTPSCLMLYNKPYPLKQIPDSLAQHPLEILCSPLPILTLSWYQVFTIDFCFYVSHVGSGDFNFILPGAKQALYRLNHL